ncbi:hypothetical protein BJF80_08940 [Serinicoccus sp. CUA-874]|nr:hypothetical protein BJF80_08940 [Serinicoccus sp. CUA-874]
MCRSVVSECRVVLPKSSVGSTSTRSGGTPACTAPCAPRASTARTSRTTASSSSPRESAYRTSTGSVRGGNPPVCETTTPAPARAALCTSSGSCPAQVSLTRSTSPAAASATSLRQVSSDSTRSGYACRAASRNGMTRSSSSAAPTSSPS